MNEFSLLYPNGAAPAYQMLSETTCNDLSLDFILSHVAKIEYEKKLMKRMMTSLQCDTEVISYRRDVFEDFMNCTSHRPTVAHTII